MTKRMTDREAANFLLGLLGVESVEVRSLLKCRRCKMECVFSITMDKRELEVVRDTTEPLVEYGSISTFIHLCREGQYGILDVVGYDWIPTKGE